MGLNENSHIKVIHYSGRFFNLKSFGKKTSDTYANLPRMRNL